MKMMQNLAMLPAATCLRLPRQRCPLLAHHVGSKALGLCQIRSHHHLRGRQLQSKSRLCNLCGKVSSTITVRRYAVETGGILSDEEEINVISDGELSDGSPLTKDQLDLVRVILYPNSVDEVVQQLSHAASIQEVFSIVESHFDHLTPEQTSQAIVTLWDLQKIYGRFGIDYPSSKSLQHSSFVNSIVNYQTFHKLLSQLESVAEDLDSNAISCLLLYLYRLGLSSSLPVMQKLLLLCAKRIDDCSYSALSRLSIYLRNQGLRGYYLQSKIVRIIEPIIKNISTPEDLKLVTICLNSSSRLLGDSAFKEYENVLKNFLSEGKLESCEPRIILKFLRFLGQKDWVQKPVELQRQMLLYLSERIPNLSGAEIIALSKYFQNIMEPREVLYKMLERVNKMIQVSKCSSRKIHLLLCIAPFTSTQNRSDFEELIVESLLDGENFGDLIPVLFKCLRSIKTSNVKLCNAFWNKAYAVVEEEIQNSELFLGDGEIIRRKVYQNYMYFNNNLGGTYRNYKVEKNMCDAFLKEMRGQTGMLPRKTARMAAFLLAYSRKEGIPRDILEKVLCNASQYSLLDIILLSRGIQISLAFQHSNVRRSYTEQITSICHIMNSCTEKQLETVTSLGNVCALTRAFLNRNGSPRTYLFDILVDRHFPFMGELNSRLLRDISHNFRHTKYCSPELLEIMAQYVINNQDYILVEMLERYLSCIYNLGFQPESFKEFFSACLNIIDKDKSKISGLSVLEMSLSLCFYGYLRSEHIQGVFNISFLDWLDEEISACYSKASYPQRVRHALMELNRAVCIDHPEEKIPWFHEKYCEDLVETRAVPNDVFQSEVHQALSQLIGGPEVVRGNAKTPYFYLLDFEFLLDGNNQPVPLSEYASVSQTTGSAKNRRIESNPGYRRIAILLRKEGCYCVNTRQLLGRHQMECRHLEILGYHVIQVPHFMWYSMAHATVEDRLQYLKKLIYS